MKFNWSWNRNIFNVLYYSALPFLKSITNLVILVSLLSYVNLISFPKGLVSFKALIEESEMKKFPDNDLLRHLRLVTQDADKCASVAQQLLNGKRQTR